MTLVRNDLDGLLSRAREGDRDALARAFDHYRDRLRRMVVVRLDARLSRRVDPSDVIQESYLDVARIGAPAEGADELPFFLWLRLVVGQRILAVERRHLGAQARDARREARVAPCGVTASTATLAAVLSGGGTPPFGAAARRETRGLVQKALERMDPIYREVLVLRHFDDLTNVEVARELGIESAAARQRYVRAARRLREVMGRIDAGSGA